MRNFDSHKQFEDIKKAAESAVRTIFPVEGKKRQIKLLKVWVDDAADSKDYQSQNKIKERQGTWGAGVYASLALVDKSTGKAIDSSEKVKLFTLPKVTDRLSYIVSGNEYQVKNQLRLKSGAYTLRKQNGELKTQVNLAKGRNFELSFNERTGVFKVSVSGGQSSIPLYPILSYLGISDLAMSNSWGADICRANRATDPKAVERLATALGLSARVSLKDYFDTTAVSGETTRQTLGVSFNKVNGLFLLAATKNLLDVHKGNEEPVDRDSLLFKEMHSLEDFLGERLEKNSALLKRKLDRQVDNLKRTKLSQILNSGAFTSVVESFFTTDDKAATPEQTNPLEMFAGQFSTTVMGSGGIGSQHAVTDDTRSVHSSHFGFLDPVHTPESENVGVNTSLPLGAIKDGKELKTTLLDKKGAKVYLTAIEAYNKCVAFPGQKGPIYRAMQKGKIIEVPAAAIDLFSPTPQAMFSISTNLIPYLATNQGNRTMMASKMLEQAISLKHREAPLVQVSGGPSGSLEKQMGNTAAAVFAPDDGTVSDITKDQITLQTSAGKTKINLYNNFELNRKSFITHTPQVKVGDRVKKGQLLADSNFTRGGVMSLGTNLRVAYLPYKGLNFEDGIVISESAATKLTSEHIHKKTIELNDQVLINFSMFKAYYPNAIRPDNRAKLDDNGIIRKGQTVRQGDVVIAALKKRVQSRDIAVVNKALSDRPKDVSVIWTMEDPGEVISVVRQGTFVTVSIKTEESAKIGDKLAGRYGNKGIITKIIQDSEAPHNESGEHVEVMLNPHGIISRINIGQVYESAAGKAALKTGKPHVVENFSGENYLDSTKQLLQRAGVKDKEKLYDPGTGKSIGKVHVGNPYILKLFKQGTANFSVRQGGPGHAYDANKQPLKAGGDEGSKAMDLLTVYSMLAHGARKNLHEMVAVKSTQNDEFWKALKSGQPLPPPKTPFAYDKFLAYLKGAGINVTKEGTTLTLGPLTDAHALEASSGEIKKPMFYRGKDMEPVKGGFFDRTATGGLSGEKWAHIELTEPTVNPVFEKAVKVITGLGKNFEAIATGKLHVSTDGTVNKKGDGLTGGAAIKQILKKIDVAEQIKVLELQAKKAKHSKLDEINKRLKYLRALKELKLAPDKAYIREVVPVAPPQYRPVYTLPNGSMASSDINVYYQNLGVLNTMAKLPVMKLLPEIDKHEIRKDTYDHLKALSGLTDMNIRGKPREGFISAIKGGQGGQPKEGLFISKLLSKKQDFTGRGTIIPDPDLGLDEVGIPEEMAWKLFEPLLVAELKTLGKNPNQAKEEIKNKTAIAKKALELTLEKRHVLLNRAPSLHKFNILAFKPKITAGRAIKIPPLVVAGFNADFDGDAMTVHVPMSPGANQEAEKLRPSRNLYQPGTGNLMVMPAQEAQVGLFYLSQTQAGRDQIGKILGPKYKPTAAMTKASTRAALSAMSKEMPPQQWAKAVGALKKIGEDHALSVGFTAGLDDISDVSSVRNKVVATVAKAAKGAKSPGDMAKINSWGHTQIDNAIEKKLKGKRNPFYDMVASGSRGDKTQLRSILATPLFMSDHKNETIPIPIRKSYSEGLDPSDYWIAAYGARRGAVERSVQSRTPGAFSKDVMSVVLDNVIAKDDCGTHDGISMSLNDHSVLDRYSSGSQPGLPHNTLITSTVITDLKKKSITNIKVRSPLTCDLPKGTCAHCHGLDEHGQRPDVGENIGVKAGQTISEPLVQLAMNTRHTGGVAGSGSSANVGGFARISQLLKLPKILHGAAALAQVDGRVTSIEKGLAGGFKVHIGNSVSFAPSGSQLVVKVGDQVHKGDRLSTGPIKPQELVALKGMMAAKSYIAEELHNEYAAQGKNIRKGIFETVVRSLANSTKVMNGGSSSHLAGDVVSLSAVNHYNKNLEIDMPTDEAHDHALAVDVGSLKKGHILTAAECKSLMATGLKTVRVAREKIEHAPFLKGMTEVASMKGDWMAPLGYRYITRAITEGASAGKKSDVAGYHPIPALAHASTFGQGKDGKY